MRHSIAVYIGFRPIHGRPRAFSCASVFPLQLELSARNTGHAWRRKLFEKSPHIRPDIGRRPSILTQLLYHIRFSFRLRLSLSLSSFSRFKPDCQNDLCLSSFHRNTELPVSHSLSLSRARSCSPIPILIVFDLERHERRAIQEIYLGGKSVARQADSLFCFDSQRPRGVKKLLTSAERETERERVTRWERRIENRRFSFGPHCSSGLIARHTLEPESCKEQKQRTKRRARRIVEQRWMCVGACHCPEETPDCDAHKTTIVSTFGVPYSSV